MSVDFSTTVGTATLVPLVYTNNRGQVMPPVPGGTVGSSDATIVTVTLSADDSSVTITAVAAGTATIGYNVGSLSAALSVTVGADVATKVDFDTPNAVAVAA